MGISVSTFTASLDATVHAAAQLAASAAGGRALGGARLIASQSAIAAARRDLDAAASVLAGEIVRRSSVEAGHSGLAQSEGFRTPQALIQKATGSTARDAQTLVRAGVMINDAELQSSGKDPAQSGSRLVEPWLAAVGAAVARGSLSAAAAEAIRTGLGRPVEGVSTEALANAAIELVKAAVELNVDELLREARDARDELDEAGIIERERVRREMRSFRRWRQPDGMTRYNWLLDPEGAAFVDGVYDQITSPRRGGPRMVDEADKARADEIVNDPRTTDQLASDAMLQLLRIGVEADPGTIVGSHNPAVRVLVTQNVLTERHGHGRLEGCPEPVSLETVERLACEAGIVMVGFDDDGQAVNVGREQRCFTRRQRIALGARDGGCRWPGCNRKVSWSEAHHVKFWVRDHGKTDLADGILLCRHHHLLLHDEHWEIVRRGGDYWLIPPPNIDAGQTPRLMPSKSAALRDLLKENALLDQNALLGHNIVPRENSA